MKYLSFVIIMFVFCSYNSSSKRNVPTAAANPGSHANKADDVRIEVFGTERDMVRFYKSEKLIGTDGGFRPDRDLDIQHGSFDNVWRNGYWAPCDFKPCTGLDIKRARVGDTYYFSVRHGALRDLVFYYAVVNDKVYRSKEWADSSPGETEYGVAIDHIGDRLEIKGFPFSESNGRSGKPTVNSSFGFITFNPKNKTFTYDKDPSSSYSSDPNRQEKILSVDGN